MVLEDLWSCLGSLGLVVASLQIFENTVSLSVNHSAAHLVAQYCWHFTIKLPITIVSNYNTE